MSSCITDTCGTGDWTGPLPGDPDNNVTLSAVPAFGGIDVSWTYPTINSHAVAHVLLYRGITNNYAASVKQATVAGNIFYDRITGTAGLRYYYWIQIVSVNGTVGAAIGPASAIASTRTEDLLKDLTGKIDSGLLANSLKGEIEAISINTEAIIDEVDRRIADSSALNTALGILTNRANAVDTFVVNETQRRIDGQNAMVNQIDIIAVANDTNYALISEEKEVRVTAIDALARKQLALDVQVNDAVSGLPATRATLLTDYSTKVSTTEAIASALTTLNSKVFDKTTGLEATRADLLNDYYTKANTDSAISQATLSLVSNTNLDTALKNYTDTAGLTTKLAAYTNTATLVNDYYTKTGADSAIANATVSLASKTSLTEYAKNGALKDYTLTADLKNEYFTKTDTTSAIANAATTLQVVGPGGIKVGLQQTMNTQYTLNSGYSSLYTIKQTNGGLIGGFGLVNDGVTVQAGFDVDSFWVGRTNKEMVKPFVIENGITYINSASIGKLKASQIDTTGLVIKDAQGKDIFGSGTNLDWSFITGTGKQDLLDDVVTAQETADEATEASTAANAALASIANDNIISPGEKPALKREYDRIINEYLGISSLPGVSTELKNNYTSARDTLVTYMTSLVGWDTLPGIAVNVNGANLRTHFANLYANRQNVLNASATNANATADSAALDATNAGISASTANALLGQIADDNILTAGEKPKVLIEYTTITSEKAGIIAQGILYGVSTAIYDAAVTSLVDYMATLPGWDTIPGSSVPLLGTSFRNIFSNVYLARQNLLNAVSTKANQLTGLAATTANWGNVTGTGRPADNADVTANNIAAGIAGQGTLATQSGVGIGTNVYIHNPNTGVADVLDTSYFVNRLSKINDTNIGTFMSNAAIGNAYIGNAAIKTANIDDLQVSTLKIAGNAVSISDGRTGNGAIPSITMTFSEPARVAIMVSCNFLAIAGQENEASCYVTANGGGGVGVSADRNFSTCATDVGFLSVGAGTHTFSGSVAVSPGTRTIGATSIVVMGVMK